jgi:hypothetical protein
MRFLKFVGQLNPMPLSLHLSANKPETNLDK